MRMGRIRERLSRRRPSQAHGEPVVDPLEGLTPADRAIAERALPHTMTSVGRLQGLIDGVRYVVDRDLAGAFVECGVWRGGSVLAMIGTLQELGVSDRDIYLFDTFEGMTEPTDHDVSSFDGSAVEHWQAAQERNERPWNEFFGKDAFSEDSVSATIGATGYPAERLHLVPGKVETTIPDAAPESIALLRLDTDWYESTRHELLHLYPRLVDGGVLLIDDYGHWDGARRAVDEYFAAHAAPLLLNRLDYTGRVAVKH
jgi:O-methyltransferase